MKAFRRVTAMAVTVGLVTSLQLGAPALALEDQPDNVIEMVIGTEATDTFANAFEAVGITSLGKNIYRTTKEGVQFKTPGLTQSLQGVTRNALLAGETEAVPAQTGPVCQVNTLEAVKLLVGSTAVLAQGVNAEADAVFTSISPEGRKAVALMLEVVAAFTSDKDFMREVVAAYEEDREIDQNAGQEILKKLEAKALSQYKSEEEFNKDLSKAIEEIAKLYGIQDAESATAILGVLIGSAALTISAATLAEIDPKYDLNYMLDKAIQDAAKDGSFEKEIVFPALSDTAIEKIKAEKAEVDQEFTNKLLSSEARANVNKFFDAGVAIFTKCQQAVAVAAPGTEKVAITLDDSYRKLGLDPVNGSKHNFVTDFKVGQMFVSAQANSDAVNIAYKAEATISKQYKTEPASGVQPAVANKADENKAQEKSNILKYVLIALVIVVLAGLGFAAATGMLPLVPPAA